MASNPRSAEFRRSHARLKRVARALDFTTTAPTHWRCPDCLQACACSDALARLSPHVRCGRTESLIDRPLRVDRPIT